MIIQLCKGAGDELEGLLLAFREVAFRPCDVRLDVGPGFLNRFDQQFHKLLRAFDVVKWSLGLEAQTRSSWAISVANRTRRFPSPCYGGFGFVGRINLDNCLSKTEEFVKKKAEPSLALPSLFDK